MKYILLLVCAAVLGTLAHHLPKDEKIKLRQLHEVCQADPSTHVDETLLKNLVDNVDDKQLGVYMRCRVVKEGLMTESGDILKDAIRSKIALVTHDGSTIDGLVEKCAVKHETPEKTAVLLSACFVQNDIHYYIEL